LGVAPVSERAYDAVVDAVGSAMGPELAEKMRPEIANHVDKMWGFGKGEMLPIGIPVITGLKDERAINWLANTDGFYVGKIFPEYEDDIVKLLKEWTLESGLGSRDAAVLLRENLGKTLETKLYPYERVVRTSATRIRNWSRIYAYDEIGIVEVEIYAMMDERTSAICREMDGKVFRVEQVIGHIEKVMAAPSDQLPELNPFPTLDQAKLDPETLIAQHGISLPPYHVNCRSGHQITDAEVIPGAVDRSSMEAGDIYRMPDAQYKKMMDAYRACAGL